MKKILFTTHALFLIIGFLAASGLFIFYAIPLTQNYIEADPHFIRLSQDPERVNYDDLLQEYYLAKLYLNHPAYFFKRDEGKAKLTLLANRGYTLAITELIKFHQIMAHRAAFKHHPDEVKYEQHIEKAYDLAIKAAEFGNYTYLHMMFKVRKPYEQRDITEEIALLEKGALEIQSDQLAVDLSVYHYTQGNTEKEEKWLTIAEEIYNSPRKEPACVTIEPQKTHTGFYNRWEEIEKKRANQ